MEGKQPTTPAVNKTRGHLIPTNTNKDIANKCKNAIN